MPDVLQHASRIRIETIRSTSEKKRADLAQHLTPFETAKLAASMFSQLESWQKSIRCLDLGAGTGMLSLALYDRFGESIEKLDAVEMDIELATVFEAEMAIAGIPYELIQGDALVDTPEAFYDKIILNPPYKKMAANDSRQNSLPCRSANLYSAFMAIGLSRLVEDGELVAIVPRSWMNGGYFEPFRKYAFSFCSLDAVHVYESRAEVFSDTDVLQETIIVKFSKRSQSEQVVVSKSLGKGDEVSYATYAAQDLIDPRSFIVRIAPKDEVGLRETIGSLGLCPSTGKVVDFRCKDIIFRERPQCRDVYPMIYAGNFQHGVLEHPLDIGKPQWFKVDADNKKAKKQLIRSGPYVVVKRFSTKEERRRVVARPLLLDSSVALENHLNFIHAGTPRNVVPLRSVELANGLSIWLNSTYLDRWFRDVSGSTQVNAGDIKSMPCPPLDLLEEAGKHWRANLTQDEIDEICEALI